MGGSSYGRDVGTSSGGSYYSGGTSSSSAKEAMGRSSMDATTSVESRVITSEAESPLVFALDVTGSNIEFARIVYDKAPMLYGQIEQCGYLNGFDISFCAVGDAYSDRAPLQVCDFKKGIALDSWLTRLYLEGNGGGQQRETYELAAYYYARQCSMPNAKSPYMFFLADEAPYPEVEGRMARNLMGVSGARDISTKSVFAELFAKFNGNVYVLQNAYSARAWGGESDSIRREWLDAVGNENEGKILRMYEEKSVVDVILGVIAVTSGKRSMQDYLKEMEGRGQTKARMKNVEKTIGGLDGLVASPIITAAPSIVPVAGSLPTGAPGRSRKSGGKRI